MNRRIQGSGIAKDDGAQALTEFAIVIPIVLLFFFAMLQYFSIVQASQLGNYAAYVAARSYAVHAALDGVDQAKQTATTAAALALAPIARLLPGEVFGLPIGSFSNLLPDWMPGQQLAEIGEGWWVAENIRLNSNKGGGSITFTKSGSPQQVDVAINYPQPIYVPGLAGLWDLVTGERIYHSLQPLSLGLNGVPGTSMPGFSDLDQAIEQHPQLGSDVSSVYAILPYINVQSKCSMGYEDWSGTLRHPKNYTSLDGPIDLSTASSEMGDLNQLGNNITDLVGSSIEASIPFP